MTSTLDSWMVFWLKNSNSQFALFLVLQKNDQQNYIIKSQLLS